MTQLQSTLRIAAIAAAALVAVAGCSKRNDADTAATSGATTMGSTADSGATTDATTAGATTMPSANDAATATAGTRAAGTSPSSGTVSDSGTSGSVASMAPAAALSSADKEFIRKAAEGGLFEAQVGKLAADKATDPAVKSYGSMLADQHTAANDKLAAVARSQNAELPSTLPADKQRQLDKLAKLQGAAFDKEFVKTVGLKDHKADIALFEKTANDSKNPALKDFATQTLPTLKDHLSHAQELPQSKG